MEMKSASYQGDRGQSLRDGAHHSTSTDHVQRRFLGLHVDVLFGIASGCIRFIEVGILFPFASVIHLAAVLLVIILGISGIDIIPPRRLFVLQSAQSPCQSYVFHIPDLHGL